MKPLKSCIVAALCLAAVSCEGLFAPEEPGELNLSIVENPLTRSGRDGASPAIDTNSFILTVTDAAGRTIFNGRYGDSPQNLIVDPGNYTIEIISSEFKEPRFDAPQYGDTQVVSVPAGQKTCVRLECAQINSGVKLNINSDFLTSYPNGILMLKAKEGKLVYGYSEKRIAYFNPGTVTLELSDGGVVSSLCSRQLGPRQILVLNVSAGISSASGAGVSVNVDTTRYWSVENYVIGGDGGEGGDVSEAISVADAADYVGRQDVWVYGYIVGGDLSSSRCSFQPPFVSNTNIAIATKSSCREKDQCVSVQLSKGDIRDALNLVDNPGNLGRQVYLKGDIVEKYYGITGLQCITEFRWK